MNNQTTNTRRRHDILFIAVLLCLTAAAALGLLLFRDTGDTVCVFIDGQLTGEYALSADRTVEIRIGDAYNILVIRDGTAYVAEASCPDGICSAHRPVSHDGESIICLPNKVVIEVQSREKNQPDITA